MPLVWLWDLSATKTCLIKCFIITPCINIMLCASSLRPFKLFFALEITKFLLTNYVYLFWLSLFFLWRFWLIIFSTFTPPSLALPKAPYIFLYPIQLLLFACAGSCTTLCQWFTNIHLYFSEFCFSPVPYFTLCFRHIVFNALTAPNFWSFSGVKLK